jgi:hypothetical protein
MPRNLLQGVFRDYRVDIVTKRVVPDRDNNI